MNIKTPMKTLTPYSQNKNILFESIFLNFQKLKSFSDIVGRFFVMGYNVPLWDTMYPAGVHYTLKGNNVALGGTESKSAGYNVPFSRYVVLLF